MGGYACSALHLVFCRNYHRRVSDAIPAQSSLQTFIDKTWWPFKIGGAMQLQWTRNAKAVPARHPLLCQFSWCLCDQFSLCLSPELVLLLNMFASCCRNSLLPRLYLLHVPWLLHHFSLKSFSPACGCCSFLYFLGRLPKVDLII